MDAHRRWATVRQPVAADGSSLDRPLKSQQRVATTNVVSYIDTMAPSRKHQRTLTKIFEEPTRNDVRWADIEALLRALGAELSEERGARVRVALGDVKAVFHRPHPRPDTDRGALRSVRRFLDAAGIGPEE